MKQKTNRSSMKNRRLNSILALFTASILIATSACKKQPVPERNQETTKMNEQELKLVGKWQFKRSETYEVSGTDSTGHDQCTLVGSSDCDSVCTLEFKGKVYNTPFSIEYEGAGSIGSCDQGTLFKWTARDQSKLKIGSIANGNIYDIVYLTRDSVAFSNTYTKDILTLRSVVYYKKN